MQLTITLRADALAMPGTGVALVATAAPAPQQAVASLLDIVPLRPRRTSVPTLFINNACVKPQALLSGTDMVSGLRSSHVRRRHRHCCRDNGLLNPSIHALGGTTVTDSSTTVWSGAPRGQMPTAGRTGAHRRTARSDAQQLERRRRSSTPHGRPVQARGSAGDRRQGFACQPSMNAVMAGTARSCDA